AAADPGRAQEAGRIAPEAQRRPAIADRLVVQGHDPRSAEHFIFDDHAAGQITATLQRHEVADAHITLDVDIGAHDAAPADDGIVADENEVPDARVRTDLRVVGNNAVAAINCGHLKSHGLFG